MAPPLLSICIPTHNRADWLVACLDSCLAQAEAQPEGLVEVVVSDNASTDRTPEVLADRQARHPLLKVNRNAINNHAINFDTVLQCAQGTYAWLMGDDDALLPGAVDRVVQLLRTEPRDLYLPHVVMDSTEPGVRRLEWFQGLPRLDWNLADPGELREYMEHGCSASAVFSFISVLIFLRGPWLEASSARPAEFNYNGWPQVATGMEYVKRHGRLRVIPEALVNYHCSTGAWGEPAWERAMMDLRGLLRVADTYFAEDPGLFRAFMGCLRKNHGDGWIAHHRACAPDAASWEESMALLVRAGFDPLKVAAVDLGFDLQHMKALPRTGLDPGSLVLADLGFIARGARRILVMTPRAAGAELARLVAALRDQTLAEVRVLGTADSTAAGLADRGRISFQAVDLVRISDEPAYKAAMGAALRDFGPDLLVNADPERRPGWDLLAMAAGGAAVLAYRAGNRPVPAELSAWLDSPYTRLLPAGPAAGFLALLGLAPPPKAAVPAPRPRPSTPPLPLEGPMKLNLGCGQEHLAGWVNVDKFPEAYPDRVHDLEQFPWPFPDGCATEVLLKHVLEHLGRDSDTFLGIMKELYRICAPGARVRILVPHPRHRDFLQDPTHVRPVLAEMFEHFSLEINEEWARRGLPGTPLALYLGLDFAIESATLNLDPWWDAEFRAKRITRDQLERAARDCNNVIATSEVVLRARKPFQRAALPAASNKLGVRWEGSQFVHHSLGHVNRQLCLGLLAGGKVELSILPYEPDQFDGAKSVAFKPLAARVNKALAGPAAVHVRHQWPPQFQPPPQGAWVMIQPWEFGGIPEEWVAPMRDQVDEIWVPSSWLKDCYVRSGIPADKVVVVPNGVDCEVFRPDGGRFPLKTAKGCRFLFLGGTIHRKGFDLLLDTYLKTFRASDDVCLVIKEQGGGVYGTPGLPEVLSKLRTEDPTAPEIEYRTDDLTEPQVAALYRACDVLVLPYRGEGFGLPIAEAMASGLPVLVTGRGAARDFTMDPWAYLIPSRTVAIPAPGGFTPSRAGFWLEEPDGAALAELMKRAYADPEERRRMGARGREHALAELGWAGPVALVQERLAALAGRSPRRNAPPQAAPAGPEAFLFPPDWNTLEWVEVVLSFLLAFKAGEPVTLVLPWSGTPGEPGLEEIQRKVLELAKGAGLQAFPDVALVDQPQDLTEFLRGFPVVTPVPRGRGAVAGLLGAHGLRLAAARARLAQPA